ncbi:MAG: hypothetical protein NWE98_02330 [Candidatus Bathyarchaeota archaeon]|nr:hypothetical protein [Candidatus Bathyarchaeota archaeon]
MRKSIVKRICRIEQQTFQPRWRVVVKDDGVYSGECGQDLSEVQFESWVRQQGRDTQVIIVEVCQDFQLEAEPRNLTFKVENHADKNTEDLLREYDLFEKEECTD